MTQNTDIPRRLSPWNPLDHLRLLLWLFVTPQHLEAYREIFGRKDERRVGKWLISTLIWLPLFIPALALGMGTLPRIDRNQPSNATWLCTGIFVLWILTGCLTEAEGLAKKTKAWSTIIGFVIIIMLGLPLTMVAVLANLSKTDVPILSIPILSMAIVIAMIFLSGPVAEIIGYDDEGQSIFGAAFVMGTIYIGVTRGHKSKSDETLVRKSVETGQPSQLVRGGFLIFLIIYALIVWICFMGGWRVFR